MVSLEEAQARVRELEAELGAERTRRRALLNILAGVAVLELARFLGPLVHPALMMFGSVVCLILVVYGFYLYSTQESFSGRKPG